MHCQDLATDTVRKELHIAVICAPLVAAFGLTRPLLWLQLREVYAQLDAPATMIERQIITTVCVLSKVVGAEQKRKVSTILEGFVQGYSKRVFNERALHQLLHH